MKKVLALLLVAVLALTLAGAALASDSDGGHVTPTPVTPEPVPDAGGGSGTPTEETVIIVQPAVTVIVLNPVIANVVTAAQVVQPIAAAIQQVITNTVANILSALGITGTTAEVKSAANIEVDTTEAYKSNTEAMQQAAARLANNSATANQTAVGSLPRGMGVKESGLQPVNLPKFAKELYGKRPQLNMFPRSANSSRSVNAAAPATGGDAVFLDSTGAVAEVIPGEANTNGAEAGVLTAVVYMAAGEKYDPVISVPTTQVTSDTALSAQTTQQSVQEEVYTNEVAVSTTTFSNYVPADVITALNSATGKTYTRVANDEVAKSGWEYDTDDTAYMNSFTTFKLVSITAAPQLSVQPGSYVFAVRFDSKDIKSASVDLYDEAEFDFYTENEMSKGAALGVKVFTVTSSGSVVDITPAHVKAGTYTEGYIAFTIDNDGIVTAATQVLYPALVAEVAISDVTPIIPVSGGGGGGCSAGFGAITLALLGGLFALRRKQ
ncbi:MAG: hypothetical protein IJS99_05290 [Synergistaceae bacterium]|nr:hypothetical protein [Synergistaceae bacterium]